MEHWPGHETQNKPQPTDESEIKGKNKDTESSFWQWPHIEHGTLGRVGLVSDAGHLHWTTAVDTSHKRWTPLGKPAKIFPETRPPPVNVCEHSARKRSERGLQYLRSYFPDVDFPGELVEATLEADGNETRRLDSFDPFLGNLLEIFPSHNTQHGSVVAFPMGELGRQLNISPFGSDNSGNALFCPAGLPSFVFETPILQVSSVITPSEWTATPFSTLLVRTHTSVSLLHVITQQEGLQSKVTREIDITRSDAGNIPVVDSRILAAGPDILVVNRSGTIYKCNAYQGGRAMQLIRTNEINNDDYFWQLGITSRVDDCFLTSCRGVKHIDFRSSTSANDVFALENSNAIVTSFESPIHDHVGRVTTTSEIIWLDDRFPKRPLLSFKHYRSFDRTLRVLTGSLGGTFLSLLLSRRNGLVTVYDVGKGSSNLLQCNSTPACLPHDGPMGTVYNGHGLLVSPSSMELSLLRLCQCGSVRRQDICLLRSDGVEADQRTRVTHRWNEDVQKLNKLAEDLQTDFGPAGGRHSTEVNLRGAYEDIFAVASEEREDGNGTAFNETLARLPNFWQENEEPVENMLTTFDIVSRSEGKNRLPSQGDFLAGVNINSTQAFRALMRGDLSQKTLAGSASWHYDIHSTKISPFDHHAGDWSTLNERLKELDLASAYETSDSSRMRRETEAREILVLDLALSDDVYSAQPITKPRTWPETSHSTPQANKEISYSTEPPEVEFGYFRPVRKIGAEHYVDKDQESREAVPVSSPLGVRLLLAEWEVGTDPKNYNYRDPYGVADLDAQPIPAYRSLPSGLTPARKTQAPPQRPPPIVVAATTQPPAVQTVQRLPMVVQSQTLERTNSERQVEPGLDAFSQAPMMSTQVLPGPFGGRPVAGGKKHVKKRIGGF